MDDIKFDRSKHVYKSTAFEELIKNTIRFFNGTPVHKLPPPETFSGTGVYALYYIGKNKYYKELYRLNRTEFKQPIYVGKAVPKGWRKARRINRKEDSPHELSRRLSEHANSISQVNNLKIEDFYCRFMILEESASDMIGTVEAALIRHYKPVWNCLIDGFGNHDPGRGRYNQAQSDWDMLHPGREWAARCKGVANSIEEIETRLSNHEYKQV